MSVTGINKPKNQVRHAKEVTNKKDLEYLLNITKEEASKKSTIMNLFADFGNGAKYNTYDILKVPAGKLVIDGKKNKNQFTTTVGLWIFNIGCLSDVSHITGYVNKTINGDVYEEINSQLSYAKLEDKITIQQLKDFIMMSQLYMSCTSALTNSHTMKMLLVNAAVDKKKKELEKKYAEGLKNNDLKVISNMENELLQFARDYLGDDPSADMYNSGARGKWGNNFKNMYVMKGPIRRTDGSYGCVTSSYIDGIKPSEFVDTNDSMVGGPYSRSGKTRDGGYKEKLFVSAFQHVKIIYGKDCGTDKYITVTLTESNIKDYMYCYIIEGSKLVEITSDNRDKYIGKTVKMRFAHMCKCKTGICEKCAGGLFKRLNMTNVGVATSQVASTLKNKCMKSFHDSTLKMCTFNTDAFE